MKIVIVGGGTAGWMTALYVNKVYPEAEVTVVESDKVGILGAGEGTTPHFLGFLSFVDISVFDLIRETKSTLKESIEFINWSPKPYYHGFNSLSNLNNKFCNQNDFQYPDTNHAFLASLCKTGSIYDVDYPSKISENNKSSFVLQNLYGEETLTKVSNHALHFDARLIAKYFR